VRLFTVAFIAQRCSCEAFWKAQCHCAAQTSQNEHRHHCSIKHTDFMLFSYSGCMRKLQLPQLRMACDATPAQLRCMQ
jgi:hypothetical protein